MNDPGPDSLRAALVEEPVPLKFGTSGRRGLVVHLTQLEVYLNARAEVEYLQSLPADAGRIRRGDEFYLAADLRPSSIHRTVGAPARGEIAQAVARAVQDAGQAPVFLGLIPTPALANYALRRDRGSIMITGSHIPFDRNGYKTNTAKGELLKKDEAPITAAVETLRARLYAQPFAESLFDRHGMFKSGARSLTPAGEAAEDYYERYLDFFLAHTLKGKRLLVYQHSAVGRDLLVKLLRRFGAEVIPAGRSDTFVPIDTEHIGAGELQLIQSLAADAWRRHGPLDAVISTDGDSDRPLLLAAEAATGDEAPCRVRFFSGDLVGMVAAEFLSADAVVVPITCNDAVDHGALKTVLEPKTRIGSPFVIAAMEQALARGRKAVCGWEANGGFLTGSNITRGGKVLPALPTRDAVLPLLCVLFGAAEKKIPSARLFERLPRRFTRSALLRNFPRPISLAIMKRYAPADSSIRDVEFAGDRVTRVDESGKETPAGSETPAWNRVRAELSSVFLPALGFGAIERINYIDGVRIYFAGGDIAHVRPSGNADELRIYAAANSPERAEAIAAMAVAEPMGILRQLEQRTRR